MIPGSVTSIEDGVFYGCRGLTSIDIPGSVTNIGVSAFEGCTGLTVVYCRAEDVPDTDNMAFEKVNTASATLYVPVASIDAYRTTAPWSEFGNIVAIEVVTEIETADAASGEKKIVQILSLDGKLQSELRKGINIVKYSDGTTKKVMR